MLTVASLKRLALVYLFLLVPAVAWIAAQIGRELLLSDFTQRMSAQVELFISNLEAEIDKYSFLPRILASNPNVIQLLRKSDDGEQNTIVNHQLQYVNEVSKAADTYLLTSNGTTIAASNWNQQPTFVGVNFAFRPYFRQAMEGKQGRYFALGTTSQRRGYYFSSPVYENDTDDVIGVAVVKVSMDRLEAAWSDSNFIFLVTDEYDIVFSTNRSEWQFASLSALAPEALSKIAANQQYPLEQLVATSLDVSDRGDMGDIVDIDRTGTQGQFLRVKRHIPDLGWSVQALGDLTTLQQALYYRVAAAILVSLLILSLLYAAALRRISLREQLMLRQRTEKQLIEARDELERRVVERTRALTASNQELQQEISERRRAEAGLRHAQGELIHAARLATLGQLSAGVTHELNQPLAAIRSYADNAITLLQRDALQDVNENLRQILQVSDRMSQITAQLKNYSRKASDEIEPVDLAECINNALSLVRTRLRSLRIDIQTDLLADCKVSGNAVRLEQVFVNLFNNALDAMEDTGPRLLKVAQTAQGRFLATTVKDSGPGIDPAIVDNIFDPFFTTKEIGVGLGLGLSISHGIIENCGGSLEVENCPGGGACFTVILEACSRPQPAAAETVA